MTYLEVSPEEIVAVGKLLALWLEELPPGYSLMSTKDNSVMLVQNPHMTARYLRLLLPAEGRA